MASENWNDQTGEEDSLYTVILPVTSMASCAPMQFYLQEEIIGPSPLWYF